MFKVTKLTACFLLLALYSLANLPDSIRMIDRSFSYLDSYDYEYIFIKKRNHYQVYQIYSSVIEKGKTKTSVNRIHITDVSIDDIEKVITASEDSNFTSLDITNFGYSHQSLQNKQDELWNYVKGKYKHWTDFQKQFAMAELLKVNNYNKALRRSILQEGYIPLSRHGGSEFKLTIYYGSKTTILQSSDNLFGFPWKTDTHETFNMLIPNLVSQIIPENKSFNKKRFNRDAGNLLEILAVQIFNDECESNLQKLAPLAFKKELSELEPFFTIQNNNEHPYYGRYIKPDSQTFKITLKNDMMKYGVSLQYFISRRGNSLYPRDSLLKKYKSIIARVQNIKFLMQFLEEDTARKIEICFFDNRAFNNYNIDGFNKNPSEWQKYDEMVKRMPDQSKFINLYCGCNFRLDKEYLENAIFFELISEFKEKSIWVLLPDETPVLWFFEGQNAYKYNYKDYKTKGVSVQYACTKFDSEGRFIK
jgi:hypothetical protein